MLYSHSRILKKYKRDLLLFKLDNLGLESKTFNNIKHLITLIEYGFDDEKIIIWENELNDTDKIIERFKIYLQRN